MVYKIKKGNHYSCFIPSISFNDTFNFQIKFLSDPSYISKSDKNQEDVNKIFGVSDSFHHHISSVRIGWFYDTKLKANQLVVYSYSNRIVRVDNLGLFNKNEVLDITLIIVKNHYLVHRKDTGSFQLIPRESNWNGPRYILHPYFGGNEVADKDYLIEIKRL